MAETNKKGEISRRSFLASASKLSAMAALTLGPLATRAAVLPAQEADTEGKLILGMVLFDGFQLLDTFGPLEMFGGLRDKVAILIIGENAGSVKSSAGPVIHVDKTLADCPPLDIVMIPGGGGARREVNNSSFVTAFRKIAEAAPHVASVCTGAAILARTGLLDGRKATTNKRAFKWATSQGEKVNWVSQARWVEDGKYFTSSGISAGIDMSLALIAKLFGEETAVRIANGAEYEWNNDARHDPFAKLNGLVP